MGHTGVQFAGRFRLRFTDRRRGLLWDLPLDNAATTQGANHLLARGFQAAAARSWFLGIISATGYTAVSTADTHASHAGWSEFVALTAGARVSWSVNPAQGGRIASSAAQSIQVSADGSVRGVFLASLAPLGSVAAAGLLYSTAVAGANYAVSAGGILSVTYSLTTQAGG